VPDRGTDDGFYTGPESEQIAGLRELGREALGCWGLEDATLTPIAYRENMTFAVDAGVRGRFALRIHQASYRSDAQIRSELAFMGALLAQGVRTPEVVPATDGSPLVVVERAGVPEPRQCDLFEWIEGRPLRETGDASLGSDALVDAYAEVGRQAAAIADVAEAWKRPPGFERPAWDAEGIFGASANLGDFRTLGGVGADDRALLDRLAARLRSDLEAFGPTPDRFGLCHGDFCPRTSWCAATGSG